MDGSLPAPASKRWIWAMKPRGVPASAPGAAVLAPDVRELPLAEPLDRCLLANVARRPLVFLMTASRAGRMPTPNSGAGFAEFPATDGGRPLRALRLLSSGTEYSVPAGLVGLT